VDAALEAALKPLIHQELWSKYNGSIPDDALIKRYLIVERKFNPAYVDSFIEQFKRTIAFAQLEPTDKIIDRSEAQQNVETASVSQEICSTAAGRGLPQTLIQAAGPASTIPSLSEGKELTLPLETGREVRIPIPMSEEDYELFMETLRLWKRRIVKSATL
jgi:hypothetical protein